jgi:hypothetical protein
MRDSEEQGSHRERREGIFPTVNYLIYRYLIHLAFTQKGKKVTNEGENEGMKFASGKKWVHSDVHLPKYKLSLLNAVQKLFFISH